MKVEEKLCKSIGICIAYLHACACRQQPLLFYILYYMIPE